MQKEMRKGEKIMNKFLNEKLMPVASKMASNKFLIAIRDGITLAMPLLIIEHSLSDSRYRKRVYFAK